MISSITVTATNPAQTGQDEIPSVGDDLSGSNHALQVTQRILRYIATSLSVQRETKQA